MIMGTCSLCGGYVQVPDVWHGITPPTPTCMRCGAMAKQPYPMLPEIPMQSRCAQYGTHTHYGKVTHTGASMLGSRTAYQEL